MFEMGEFLELTENEKFFFYPLNNTFYNLKNSKVQN